jgi:hypothetical protein
MALEMLEMGDHSVSSGLMGTHAPKTFRTTLYSARIQP